ncbi:isoprenoid synthase domain-containing protein [Podospora australis]|uniref:Isoprenoid synthase domain-containing protein n=1 Tax=Podospora australis TaxID=1536484 RepID=A0AAN7AGM2_9PEZI|nr:isoprenoid synthase domain-containing protein [Podospora australis]
MDDYFDKHTLAENAIVVSRLQSLLSSPATFTPASTINSMHATLFAKSFPIEGSLPILETYIAMLECHCIPTRGTTLSSLREYLIFCEVDVGMPICVELLYWTDPSLSVLSSSERESLAQLEKVANFHVSILNDVFSFEREWKAAQKAEGGALVNSVAVLAGEMNVSVHAARQLCLALVRAWEVEFLAMSEKFLTENEGEERLVRAVKGIERRMSGAEAFSWRTARYL